jgi:hypothetical protein
VVGCAAVLVASFCSLPVGCVRWTAGEPMITVVVKATYALVADGEVALAYTQDALSLDVPEPLGDAASLRVASDFVPRKEFADVLLVGHAKADTPTTQIEARLVVDVFDKSFVALAGAPVTRVPLVARHLRASAAPGAPAVVLGPRAAWERSAGAAGAPAGGVRHCPEGFDFSYFNYAPADQRVGLLRPNPAITLVGLLDGAHVRRCWLPGSRPRVFAFGEAGPGRAPAELQMAADTLWIDCDRAVCTLTFRGVSPLSRFPEPPTTLVVALERRGASSGWASLASRVDTIARTVAAEAPGADAYVEDSEFETTRKRKRAPELAQPAPVDPPSIDPDDDGEDLTVTRARVPPRTRPMSAVDDSVTRTRQLSAEDAARLKAALPFQGAAPSSVREPAAPAPPSTPEPSAITAAPVSSGPFLAQLAYWESPAAEDTRRDAVEPDDPVTPPVVVDPPSTDDKTTVVDEASVRAARALPFGRETLMVEPGRLGAALPFARDLGPPALVSQPPPVPLPPNPDLGAAADAEPRRRGRREPTTMIADDVALRPALPFSSPDARPADIRVLARPSPEDVPPARLSGGRLHDEPPPLSTRAQLAAAAAAEAAREPLLPLDRYAEVKAAIWAGAEPRERVLEQHGLGEVDWLEHERKYAAALAAEAELGKRELAQSVRAAISRASGRGGGAPTDELMPIDEYVALRVEIERATSPADVLRERGVSEARWRATRRGFQDRARLDKKLAEELARKLDTARDASSAPKP